MGFLLFGGHRSYYSRRKQVFLQQNLDEATSDAEREQGFNENKDSWTGAGLAIVRISSSYGEASTYGRREGDRARL